MRNRKSLMQQAAEEQNSTHRKMLELEPALLSTVSGGFILPPSLIASLFSTNYVYNDSSQQFEPVLVFMDGREPSYSDS